MSPEELEQAITGPAARVGVAVRAGPGGRDRRRRRRPAGALPLLQYTLTELFDHRDGDVIAPAAYRAMGGLSGALARRAEILYAGLDDRPRR